MSCLSNAIFVWNLVVFPLLLHSINNSYVQRCEGLDEIYLEDILLE